MPEPLVAEAPMKRRPLKTRDVPVFRAFAGMLARGGVTPNAISASSVVFAFVAAGCLGATSWLGAEWTRLLWFGAVAGIQLRLLANMLDGMVAVEGRKGGPTGELWNEAPDRVADVAILLGAGYAAGSVPLLGWVASVGALFVAYVRALGASAGVGQVFAGPMAKPQRMFWLTLVGFTGLISPRFVSLPANGFTVISLVLLFGAIVDVKTLSRHPSATRLFRALAASLLAMAGAVWLGHSWSLSMIGIALLSISLGTVVTSAERLLIIAKLLKQREVRA